MIKLLATDVDGTLLNSAHELTPRTYQAIQQAKQLGVHVVLATGRQYLQTRQLHQELALTSPQINSDGAIITDILTEQVLFRQTLPASLAQQVIEVAQTVGITLLVVRDGLTYATAHNEDTEYTLTYGDPLPILVDDLRHALEPLPLMLTGVAYRKDDLFHTFEQACQARFGDQLRVVRSSPYYIQVLHPHASKGHALGLVCQQFGLEASEVLAVGDSFNDISMFQFAGTSAVMGHSPDAVKAHATHVTGTCDEDGLAQVIERFILNP